MKNKWIKILLTASLALNLAFISTAVYKRIIAPGEEKKPARDTRYTKKANHKSDFNLRKDQKEEIKKIIKTFRVKRLEFKQDILDRRIAIIEAMSDSDFNPEDIEEKTGQLNQLENKLNLLFVDALIQINTTLEPEQRLNFLYKLSRNWFFIHKARPPGRPIKKGGSDE